MAEDSDAKKEKNVNFWMPPVSRETRRAVYKDLNNDPNQLYKTWERLSETNPHLGGVFTLALENKVWGE